MSPIFPICPWRRRGHLAIFPSSFTLLAAFIAAFAPLFGVGGIDSEFAFKRLVVFDENARELDLFFLAVRTNYDCKRLLGKLVEGEIAISVGLYGPRIAFNHDRSVKVVAFNR